jgi:hypothetical protein
MSKTTLFQEVLKIALHKKQMGQTKVFRTTIYDIVEYLYGKDSMFSGKAITRKLMEDVATAVGGQYLPGHGGSSHIKF